ncbi:DUF4386 domain-containing protein [Hydrogenovibrio sp. JE_KL2]|uniref:DUF4386 domain-containing protein n=1 Tax=Hydrogenovibrio sp. JE_KL2 TaxID=2651188 RepID=UPI00128DFD22|nr:DUF4386 domain-containing protein [Hydrogenovibrio sp. JE_KL2]MPQ75881.1 DUF4386 domain-containing protein [Hydrogenovibrio sp. JE_KL2]
MSKTFTPRMLSLITGISYFIIFFAAIFANFFVIEALLNNPKQAVQSSPLFIRAGTLAFMITVIFDIVIAWSLYELYKTHPLSGLAALFRMAHAIIMGVAISALPFVFSSISGEEILRYVSVFNTIWLIGLFFFGVHLILLGNIIGRPKIIAVFLVIAGFMYMLDTAAHFMLSDYETYASIFLALVAIPSIFGEMSFAIWLLIKGGKNVQKANAY